MKKLIIIGSIALVVALGGIFGVKSAVSVFNSFVEKQQAVNMAKQGQIAGVGIAHRGDTEYLKSIPDGSENNNLGNLPSVSPNTQG